MGPSTRHRVRQWRTGSSLRRSKCNSRNIRDLPTVFSNVLTQKSAPDRITVVCNLGMVTIDLLDVGNETWIYGPNNASCRATTDAAHKAVFRPSDKGTRSLIALYRPRWITSAIDLLTSNPRLTSTRQTSDFCDPSTIP